VRATSITAVSPSGFGDSASTPASSVGPGLNQAVDENGIAIACRPHQRRGAERIGRIDIRPGLDDPLDDANGLLTITRTNGIGKLIRTRHVTGHAAGRREHHRCQRIRSPHCRISTKG
jgi:hypothetical protein